VIEVNGNPGSQIIGVTGYNYFIDLVEMVESSRGRHSTRIDIVGPDLGVNIEADCLWVGEKLNAQATRSWENAPWNRH
jgi:hypothetical protein